MCFHISIMVEIWNTSSPAVRNFTTLRADGLSAVAN
jgi:hypothetical protein